MPEKELEERIKQLEDKVANYESRRKATIPILKETIRDLEELQHESVDMEKIRLESEKALKRSQTESKRWELITKTLREMSCEDLLTEANLKYFKDLQSAGYKGNIVSFVNKCVNSYQGMHRALEFSHGLIRAFDELDARKREEKANP